MITVPEATEKIVKRSRYLSEALSKEIINHSSLARYMKPEIEEITFKRVSLASIIMALNRLEKEFKPPKKNKKSVLLQDISVKSNICEYVIKNSNSLSEIREKLTKSNEFDEKFMTISIGKHYTSIISSEHLSLEIKKNIANEEVLYFRNGLAAITVKLSLETLEAPGVFYNILKSFAWENINIIDIFSTYLDFTIVIEEKDLENAFSVVKSIFTSEDRIY